MSFEPLALTRIVIVGYLLGISFETPVLFLGLGKRYSSREKLSAGFLLTAFSYPFVTVLFPTIWNPSENYCLYAIISEIFAPVSECFIFALLFQRGKTLLPLERAADFAVIVIANLVSYLTGEFLKLCGLHFV